MGSLDQGFVLHCHTDIAALVSGDGFHLIDSCLGLRGI